MNKVVNICLAALFSITILIGCNKDFLNQSDPNSISADIFIASENDALLALNGVYQALRSGNAYAETSTLFNEERSDNTGREDNQSSAGEPFQFNDFSLLPSNTFLKNHWFALYEIIVRANYVIDGVEKLTFKDQNLKNNYLAQARFLRAYTYYHLVTKWGDVPLVTSPINTLEGVREKTFREKKEVVFDQMVQDLKFAVEQGGLPNHQPANQKGRVSKAAAAGFLGKVYLTMACTISPEKKTDNLQNAKKYLEDCYAMKEFASLKDISYESVFDVAQKTTNKEIIFQIEYVRGDANYYSRIAANNQARGETINSLRPSTGAGGNVKRDLVNDYEANDLRKDYSIKFAAHPTVNDWFITKFRDASPEAGTNGWGGNDWILMRYADIILLLAEVNMLLNNDAVAIDYLNMVRERAKMPTYQISKNDPAYASKYPTLKLAILHERRVELAFENQRLFDLLRNFTAQEFADYLKSKKQSEYGLANLSNVGAKDYYYPIPFDEYKLDPEKMYQNPGY